VAFMVLHLETDDFDTWKGFFDSDPAGRKETAKGHTLSRGVEIRGRSSLWRPASPVAAYLALGAGRAEEEHLRRAL